MPMRSKRSLAVLRSIAPRLDHEHLNVRSENQPPPQFPPLAADSNPSRRTIPSQRSSLVTRNAKKSRNTSLLTSIPRYNHYLLARSLLENDQPTKQLTSERKSRRGRKAASSQSCNDTTLPDSTVSDFVWRFSAPHLDPETFDTLAMLKSIDPETFNELLAGLD